MRGSILKASGEAHYRHAKTNAHVHKEKTGRVNSVSINRATHCLHVALQAVYYWRIIALHKAHSNHINVRFLISAASRLSILRAFGNRIWR